MAKESMKKFNLHLDALICISLLFILSFSFNLFQRYQYSDLLKEHTGMQLQVATMEFTMAMNDVMLKKCANIR